jgi:hypothetical protein
LRTFSRGGGGGQNAAALTPARGPCGGSFAKIRGVTRIRCEELFHHGSHLSLHVREKHPESSRKEHPQRVKKPSQNPRNANRGARGGLLLGRGACTAGECPGAGKGAAALTPARGRCRWGVPRRGSLAGGGSWSEEPSHHGSHLSLHVREKHPEGSLKEHPQRVKKPSQNPRNANRGAGAGFLGAAKGRVAGAEHLRGSKILAEKIPFLNHACPAPPAPAPAPALRAATYSPCRLPAAAPARWPKYFFHAGLVGILQISIQTEDLTYK